jgi:hypothetical protein
MYLFFLMCLGNLVKLHEIFFFFFLFFGGGGGVAAQIHVHHFNHVFGDIFHFDEAPKFAIHVFKLHEPPSPRSTKDFCVVFIYLFYFILIQCFYVTKSCCSLTLKALFIYLFLQVIKIL